MKGVIVYLSPAHRAVITHFEDTFPLPTTGDDAARDWTHRLAQQMRFSFPSDGWGHKSASPTRPHSADCIALLNPFIGWDVVGNAGTPQAVLTMDGESIDLSGQTFEPVEAVNYLGGPPPDPPPPGDLEARVTRLEEASRAIAAILSHI